MTRIRFNVGEQVETDRKLEVARIEVAKVISTPRRDVAQDFISQIPMWINNSNSVAQGDMLKNQIAKQGGFSRAGLADDVVMLSLINGRYAKRQGIAPSIA